MRVSCPINKALAGSLLLWHELDADHEGIHDQGELVYRAAERVKHLKKIEKLAQAYYDLAMNPQDNGVGELEARAALFAALAGKP